MTIFGQGDVIEKSPTGTYLLRLCLRLCCTPRNSEIRILLAQPIGRYLRTRAYLLRINTRAASSSRTVPTAFQATQTPVTQLVRGYGYPTIPLHTGNRPYNRSLPPRSPLCPHHSVRCFCPCPPCLYQYQAPHALHLAPIRLPNPLYLRRILPLQLLLHLHISPTFK